jgi:hypothetical protein
MYGASGLTTVLYLTFYAKEVKWKTDTVRQNHECKRSLFFQALAETLS